MIKRTLEQTVQEVSRYFPVVLLAGARQIGKTTLFESCVEQGRTYVSLDDYDARVLAQEDPALFFQQFPPPLIIDEVQYAPQLFSAIKLIVDRDKQSGMFWLTGSQKFHLMQGVTETLAGRVAVLDMLGFSQKEMTECAEQSRPFLPTPEWLEHTRKVSLETDDADDTL